MDRKFESYRSDCPMLKLNPSEYMTRGNFFFSAEPVEQALPYVLDHIGEGSDHFCVSVLSPRGGSGFAGGSLMRKDVSEQQKRKSSGTMGSVCWESQLKMNWASKKQRFSVKEVP